MQGAAAVAERQFQLAFVHTMAGRLPLEGAGTVREPDLQRRRSVARPAVHGKFLPDGGLPSKLLVEAARGTASSSASASARRGPQARWQGAPVSSTRSFDYSSAATACRPPLTTVRQPVEEMASMMARLLDEHLRGARTEPTSVIFDPEVVVRESA